MKQVACIHTVYSVIAPFTETLRAELPQDSLIHTMYDDFLATDPARTGVFSQVNHERLRLDMKACELTGADIIVVSCSTLSPSVRLLRREFSTPIIAIDDAMMEAAVRAGSSIGLLATANSTVEPSRSALLSAADAAGKTVSVQTQCNEEAIRRLKAGDREGHDALVMEMADRLRDCDVIVLAQASAAHMEQAIVARYGRPTFSSPQRCARQVRAVLESR